MAKALLRSIRGKKRKAALEDLSGIAKKEIVAAMMPVKQALVKSHELIVADWESDVGFAARTVVRKDSITIYVFPTGEDKKIWYYVDLGVPPHQMPAVVGKLMVFQAGGQYVPKTLARPARTVAGGGRVVGGTKVVTTKRRAFTHPGSEGRGFTKQIAKDYQPEFRNRIDNAFRRAARRTYE